MTRPKTLEVADVLREKKMFYSKLNNIYVKNWEEKHYEEWRCILNNEICVSAIHEKLRNKKKGIQILRVSDKKIYESIEECVNHNSFEEDEMAELLKKGKEYKKIVIL
jgi:cell division septum initiation protein DivIVA